VLDFVAVANPAGVAKAWVNFNGFTNTIRKSFNVESITKNGEGDYNINFTNALDDASYVITGNGSTGTSGSAVILQRGNATTTSFRVEVKVQSDGSRSDSEVISIAVFD
jgi:hypothetical protein